MEEIVKRIVLFILISVFLSASQIYIAASANLTYVMPEIIKAFNEKYPNIKVNFITSSSGKLTAQILREAPYDIFLSANLKYPKFLYSKGIGVFPPAIYAKGKICLFSVKHKNLSLKNLKTYSSIAISKPKTTPYGKAALESFKKAGIYPQIKDKLIYAETVAAVLSYIKNGADVGIISKSLIYSKNIKNLGKFYYKDINTSFYHPINQGILLLSKKNEAKKFYNFLLSQKTKNILKRYGYDTKINNLQQN